MSSAKLCVQSKRHTTTLTLVVESTLSTLFQTIAKVGEVAVSAEERDSSRAQTSGLHIFFWLLRGLEIIEL